MSVLNPKLSSYGPGLRVPAVKRLKAIQKENEVRKERGQYREEEEEAREGSS